MCDEVEGDQHLVNWNDGFEENGHFSSPEEIQNHPSSFDVGFGFRSPDDESSSKRIKFSPLNQQEEEEIDTSEQSSPLGLTLKKSPSLISLLEEKLSKRRQANTPTKLDCNGDHKKPTSKMDDFGSQPMSEKLKASNFPAMYLKIGTWERISMHESDLVAKCYYAKRKLVWEVLEGALKSKIEILWSDIIGIRATIADDQSGSLEVELHQPPSFYRETNPQPRKHTLWQQASDFTGGQAPICRRHYVRFSPGTLDKHYEKLLQCDERLLFLSKRPFPSQESLYFDANAYGLSEFSLDFNRFGSQFFPPLQYPCQSFPAIPIRIQNMSQTTRPHIMIMDSNPPMSVNNFMLEDQTSTIWNEANSATESQIQLARPVITTSTHANLGFPSHIINSMTYEEIRRISNGDNGLLGQIENHLLGDTQMVFSDDQNTITARMGSMYPSSPAGEVVNLRNGIISEEQMIQVIDNSTEHGSLLCYSEPMNSPHDFCDGMVMQPVTNSSPHQYALPAYRINEEFSTLNTNPNMYL